MAISIDLSLRGNITRILFIAPTVDVNNPQLIEQDIHYVIKQKINYVELEKIRKYDKIYFFLMKFTFISIEYNIV